ncbi:MAG: ATP synthase F1 subunit epsilon [Candidatus Levybacteria bacterium]|nr:ATP synthase F1 subunit epsilon [Candidatus Levybacteria bacterium]
MHLDIVTPEKIVYSEDIEELTVPTPQGEISILPEHVALVTRVSEGELIVKTKGKSQFLAVTGGFLQVQDDRITLLADYAIRSEEIDTQKVLEARKRAEEALKKKREDMSERDFTVAESEMRRAILELKISNKRRKHTNIPGQ